ncbi:MAG: pyrroloquinoline quinone biosynthesis peptide chaperone PqqD [Candidatus Eremiobacteraeota bacterium]|nr:pyrroloquinoline quinone biosynthesis peptide chaperone PqqD [Candidatus Eremiobacteraeota bacterium]MBV9055075.1 pyrroloquinoline quinone biosynthesis peptide chaperone PqqD [Candidatus Eremiobacteraeota bacterium]MBV9698855.1 pyrroloquinoline quinone biosynthesis peptide chaperone PqqD [Candidatus Eremiobacteraeota bacterium]
MNVDTRPQYAKGVKLRHEGDGSAMLLVPEGALELNQAAAAALDLVDGSRSLDDIVAAIVARFEVSRERAQLDVTDLLERLNARGFIILR